MDIYESHLVSKALDCRGWNVRHGNETDPVTFRGELKLFDKPWWRTL
jgi:hypothetical protein